MDAVAEEAARAWPRIREWPWLPPGEVHVWRCALDPPAAELEQLRALLSPEEAARAARFHFEADRRAFVAARGYLRRLLGGYLGQSPASVELRCGSHGKPEVAGTAVGFNLSHSGGAALFAFAREADVGVDLERHRADLAQLEIAEHFFSPAEVAALRSVPESGRQEAFFDCWTRKEAFIKALGEGLSHPLDSFDVALLPGEPARLLATRPDPEEASRWTLRSLDVGRGWSAALAVRGGGWKVTCFAGPPPRVDEA